MHYLVLLAAILGQEPNQPKGHLVIAGGGATIPEITEKALALSGGKKAHVLIIPQASSLTGAGEGSVQHWRQAGALEVTVLDTRDKSAAMKAVKTADLIWMPGGSQSRLMQTLKQLEIIGAIRERFREGVTVGGTSAGAAVMSLIMLIGENDLGRVTDDAVRTAEGLGLWPDVIIDQHYLRRLRFNRLLSVVLDHSDNVGIGIDESTAIVVTGRSFEVIGKSNVLVIDARKTVKLEAKDGEPEAAANVALHVLRAGMTFDLDKGLLSGARAKVATSPKAKVPHLPAGAVPDRGPEITRIERINAD